MADADIDQLVAQLEVYNTAYRNGRPQVEDAVYDRLVEKLRALDPGHPFLQAVEPETFAGRTEVRHPMAMLSTEKAYTVDQLARFVARVEKEAQAIGIQEVLYRVTPKLDGLAGRDDGTVFASRGNGLVGYDITNAFAKGVVALGGRGQGLGEIVVVQSYFQEYLADKFEHPRNMVVGIVSSDTLNKDAVQALEEGMVRFVPYSQLPHWQGDGRQLLQQIDAISDGLVAGCDYPLDGVVVEVVDARLKDRMGATTHHYRWQIAVKRKGETAVTQVENIQWQVGRTGNITPVLEVSPVPLSGATIRRVTAHHAGMVAKLMIGPGARIEIIRSGEVIPKLEKVLAPSQEVNLPQQCPACGQELVWEKDFLRCTHLACPAQTERRIVHWFRTLGNADWFGIKTVQKLVAAGYDTLEKIYTMQESDFAALGFGPVQSRNLAQALLISRTKPVEDWRFLAALGISYLGVGDSRKLLQHVPLEDLLSVEKAQIQRIHGFGEKTSERIVADLIVLKDTLRHLLALGFALEKSVPAAQATVVDSSIAGKNLVFTGKMLRGSRETMQEDARRLGANVQSAVSGTTDYLICGEKVGPTKLAKATQLGVQILSEEDYYQLLKG
ncbi:MAG: helix-hairpin-helix domain-containing protein [Desulfobacteraceae bacterium]|nr:helix-hairpin-helix domain-containing protein [Desulfobacteraceae bacterium]